MSIEKHADHNKKKGKEKAKEKKREELLDGKAKAAEVKELQMKEQARQAEFEAKSKPVKKNMVSGKSMGNANKAMSQAMEMLVQDAEGEARTMPIF